MARACRTSRRPCLRCSGSRWRATCRAMSSRNSSPGRPGWTRSPPPGTGRARPPRRQRPRRWIRRCASDCARSATCSDRHRRIDAGKAGVVTSLVVGRVNMNLARRIDTWGGLLISAALFAASRVASLFGGRRLPPMRATTPPKPGAPPLRPQRILAIKFYGLGNIVMVIPVVQALREALPGAEVDFLTLEENCTLLERSGLVSGVLGMTMRGYGPFLLSLWRAVQRVRARRYDLVVDFEQFVKLSAIVAFLSGAPERIGFNTDGQRRGWLYTIRVVYTDSEHMSRIFMRLLRPLGIAEVARPVHLATELAEVERVEDLLAAHGVVPGHFPLITVHVGSGD